LTVLWLQLVGALTVYRDGQAHTGPDVGSRRARTLLALLAVERPRPVPADRIAEVLWDDAPPRRPARSVATLVSRLRGTFGRDLVAGGSAGYSLGEAVGTDLGDAAARVVEAQARLSGGEPSEALAAACQALDLLGAGQACGGRGGDALADEPDVGWTKRARTLHVELLRRARHTAATAGLDAGDHVAAMAAAEAAAAADPFDEVAHRAWMRAHAMAAEPARALRTYENLRERLARELGVGPEGATRQLHVAILREQIPPPEGGLANSVRRSVHRAAPPSSVDRWCGMARHPESVATPSRSDA
jgi:DNA-binding SARP family transcriptional activator